jgi:hypothetical protein
VAPTAVSSGAQYDLAILSSTPNLRVLTPSRRKLIAGDIFTLSPKEGLFVFGRVVSTDALAGPIRSLNLMYIYDETQNTPEPPPEDVITPERLLVPPMMINRLPWSRGYFENIAHRGVTPMQLLPQHCFKDSRGRYYDEHGNELIRPVEPVGERGVQSFRTVDDAVSDALGIPRAP